jgi:DUF438 domain-containing protein/uncharacterized protein (DUF2249 family)
MHPNIQYLKLDGRGENETFQNCVLDALKKLEKGEGLHIIKEFEPLPLYALMEKNGLGKHLEKVSENEYHAWFFPIEQLSKMDKHLNLDKAKLQQMMDIKLKVFRKEISPEEAKILVNKTFKSISAEEFAVGEQHMLEYGITDDVMVEGMDDIIDIFKDVLEKSTLNLPKGHPIQTYIDESEALEQLVKQAEIHLNSKFIKNEWLDIYDKLQEINTHFSRKQNQLFSLLEKKGFDRPSKVMWTFDNNVRDAIKKAYELLQSDRDAEFVAAQENVFHLVRDILDKEKEILYPTSLKLISDKEFAIMRISDDEIGYCLIDIPPAFEVKGSSENTSSEEGSLMSDLMGVLSKHGIADSLANDKAHDVSMGKLTLAQINLIFKHLQVDLSYVDENDIVKFYSDTQHRVFPRSAGVIGREVQNCHPRESVKNVEAIIDAFRKGEQDKAEFWLEMGGKFIYIIYNAVRDEQDNFRGVLEMMQDVTHIRSLTGSQKLLTWENSKKENVIEEEILDESTTNFGIHKGSIIAPLLKKHPYLKEYLISLSPKYKQLNNPVIFNTMGNVATLEMIAGRGDFKTEDLVTKLIEKVKSVVNS